MSGYYYFLFVVDDFSHVTWVFLLRDKSEAYERIKQSCLMVKTQFGTCVMKVRSDTGTQFSKGEL